MALYQDGILISGANTLPKMTLSEYNALPADQRPTYWERTDADYDDVLAPKTDIATVESGTTASRAYSVGELVYVSGTLYRVKTAIASGATFTVGTNVEVKKVSDAIGDKVNKSGDTISGNVTVNGVITLNRTTGTTTTLGNSDFNIGNNVPQGTVGNSRGRIVMYGTGSKYTVFQAPNSTTNRTISLPNSNGTVAIAEKTNCRLSEVLTFTDGKRQLNLSQLSGKYIKMLINVYANGDIPVHFYMLDSQYDNFQIMIVLDGNYSTYSGDVSMSIIYDEV